MIPALHRARLARFDRARLSKHGILPPSRRTLVQSRASISPKVRRSSDLIHASILNPSTLEEIVRGIRKLRIGVPVVSRTTCPLYLITPMSYVGLFQGVGRCQSLRISGRNVRFSRSHVIWVLITAVRSRGSSPLAGSWLTALCSAWFLHKRSTTTNRI